MRNNRLYSVTGTFLAVISVLSQLNSNTTYSAGVQDATPQLAPASVSSESLPRLVIPAMFPATLSEELLLPIELKSNGTELASTAFSIDYNASCLSFNDKDVDQDGLADGISTNLSADISLIAQVDLTDTHRKIDLLITDPLLPFTTLPDGVLLTLSFTADCIPSDGGIAPVSFVTDPSPSFGNLFAHNVEGASTDGSVYIAIATPTPTPTKIPTKTPIPTSTSTPTPTSTSTHTSTPTHTSLPTNTPTSTPTIFWTPVSSPTPATLDTATAQPTSASSPLDGTARPVATLPSPASPTPDNGSADEESPNEDEPAVIEFQPIHSVNNVAITINIFGRNFTPKSSVALVSSTDGTVIEPSVFYVDNAHLIAKVPSGAAVDTYQVQVRLPNGNRSQISGLFEIQDAATFIDLRADPYYFWTLPQTIHAGESLEIGLIIERFGGTQEWHQIPVSIWSHPSDNRREGAITELGKTIVKTLGIDVSYKTEPIDIPSLPAGEHILWAQIDPGNLFPETDKSNNIISRTLTILPQGQDTSPPIINELHINDFPVRLETGASDSLLADDAPPIDPLSADPMLMVDQPELAIKLSASDNAAGSGIAFVSIVELQWSLGAKSWGIAKSSEWQPFSAISSWTLHPDPGMRFLLIWVSDKTGNVTTIPATTQLNYMPQEDQLIPGESRIYRHYATAGSCLTVNVMPEYGDPDLYIWSPEFHQDHVFWYSINSDGQQDNVALTAPTSGFYQIEIEGLSQTHFLLSALHEEDACPRQNGEVTHPPSGLHSVFRNKVIGASTKLDANMAQSSHEKSPRTQPQAPLETEPPTQLNLQPPPIDSTRTSVYLPFLR